MVSCTVFGSTEYSICGHFLLWNNHIWSSRGLPGEYHSAILGRARTRRHLDAPVSHHFSICGILRWDYLHNKYAHGELHPR